MDATVILEESIVELARAAGKADQVAEITERAMAGEMDFSLALHERVAVLKGLPTTIFQQTLPRLHLQPGIEDLLSFALRSGCRLYLVSGGFMELAGPLGQTLGFHGVHANELLIDGDLLLGKVGDKLVDGTEKSRFVAETILKAGFLFGQVVVVGDGANDREMMSHAGMAFGFRPKTSLVPFLNGAVFDGDHRVICAILS
jgi:phosphoserine phosphatase